MRIKKRKKKTWNEMKNLLALYIFKKWQSATNLQATCNLSHLSKQGRNKGDFPNHILYWKQKSSQRSKNDRITNATINNCLETEQRRKENWLLYFSIWFYRIGCWKAKTNLNIFQVINFFNFRWKSQWKYHSLRGSRRIWKVTAIPYWARPK